MEKVNLLTRKNLFMVKADKNLGQHFLKDKTVIEKICSDHHGLYDVIIEVGPGPGALSKELSKIGKPLYFIEKDERFIEDLELLTSKENIFHQDALEFNWEDFLTQNDLSDKKIWLVSNLPYNVGTILFVQFLQISQIQFMTLMFQKEVGEKTFLRNIKNEMSGLLFLSLNYFQSKQLCKVLPGAFNPPPKVNSNVVSYIRKEQFDISIEEFSRLNNFTRTLFAQKRKQLSAALKKLGILEKVQEDGMIAPTLRAETLSYQQVLRLYQFLK